MLPKTTLMTKYSYTLLPDETVHGETAITIK